MKKKKKVSNKVLILQFFLASLSNNCIQESSNATQPNDAHHSSKWALAAICVVEAHVSSLSGLDQIAPNISTKLSGMNLLLDSRDLCLVIETEDKKIQALMNSPSEGKKKMRFCREKNDKRPQYFFNTIPFWSWSFVSSVPLFF